MGVLQVDGGTRVRVTYTTCTTHAGWTPDRLTGLGVAGKRLKKRCWGKVPLAEKENAKHVRYDGANVALFLFLVALFPRVHVC